MDTGVITIREENSLYLITKKIMEEKKDAKILIFFMKDRIILEDELFEYEKRKNQYEIVITVRDIFYLIDYLKLYKDKVKLFDYIVVFDMITAFQNAGIILRMGIDLENKFVFHVGDGYAKRMKIELFNELLSEIHSISLSINTYLVFSVSIELINDFKERMLLREKEVSNDKYDILEEYFNKMYYKVMLDKCDDIFTIKN